MYNGSYVSKQVKLIYIYLLKKTVILCEGKFKSFVVTDLKVVII